ncbi:hypothetical protein GCM10011371_22290 [Novosphingobium marinum]|uniref:DUF192 domain-containing protein n=1 Tax=Novosphingobium marinum TaxID=1514948 RepID=A0A7Y9Y0A2_9SPHN|nr:DUF192 domain-containing protein [Novosphingobium marinum]NYH96343.1 hypothetical protein [Novosphingobium marinum]GGC34496.1 hypothetical protein GCM10011371_22290 [Novosphingobium marinum]
MRMEILPLFAAAALAACSQGTASEGAVAPSAGVAEAGRTHPVSGLEVIPLTVRTAGGKLHRFDVEVARSDFEQAKGLMFRTELAPGEGMLFPYDPPEVASFWMKNTVIPLDIIFIDPKGRIINIAAQTVPYSTDSVVAEGKAGAVLELAGGRAAELGIAPGDKVSW